jgi:hypothetical protein
MGSAAEPKASDCSFFSSPQSGGESTPTRLKKRLNYGKVNTSMMGLSKIIGTLNVCEADDGI